MVTAHLAVHAAGSAGQVIQHGQVSGGGVGGGALRGGATGLPYDGCVGVPQ